MKTERRAARLRTVPPDAGFLDDALGYARIGWPVFPLRRGEKVPLIAKAAGGNGVHDATTDPDRIREWWARRPDANIGLACGVAFWALDLDKGGPGEPGGVATLAHVQERFGPVPATVQARTGSGGRHLLFLPDARITNTVREIPGCDTRSTGGYVVAPPSRHPSGASYEWIAAPDEIGIAAAPEWLIALLEPLPPEQEAPPARPITGGKVVRYAAVALERACGRIARAPWGAQADTLDHEAYGLGRLVGGGVISRSEAEPGLVAAGCRMPNQDGREPWTRRQIAWRVARALGNGIRNPRAPESRT